MPLPSLLPGRNLCAVVTMTSLLFFPFYLLYPGVISYPVISPLTGQWALSIPAWGQDTWSAELSGPAHPQGRRG